MANNVNVTDGTGTSSVAAEQIGNTKYQQIKLIGGEVGSTSVLGVNPDRSMNVSVIGTVQTTLSGQGSVIAVLQGSSIIGIVTGSVVALPTGNQSVSGAVTFPAGSIATIVNPAGSVTAVSGTVGASIVGQLPAGTAVLGSIAALQGTNPWVVVHPAASITSTTNPAGSITAVSATFVAGSVATVVNPAGSITGVRTDNASVIAVLQSSSILAVPVGSVITVLQAASIVGTYSEDAAHTTADKGLFTLNVRNDTMASITSADGDYSPLATGPVGEGIMANAPLTKWVSGNASMLGGVPMFNSVLVIAAQGASIFTYITGVQVANLGSASVLVTFFGATNSIVGYTIAPAGGGSNIYYQNGLKTNQNAAFSASISGTASVYVAAQGFISKT